MDVHDQETDVGKHVDDPPAVVEGEAVDDAGSVVDAEDVVGGEVAVDISHEPAGQSSIEETLAAGEVPPSQRLSPGEVLRVDHRADVGAQRIEVVTPVLDKCGVAGRQRTVNGFASRMQARYRLCDRPEMGTERRVVDEP